MDIAVTCGWLAITDVGNVLPDARHRYIAAHSGLVSRMHHQDCCRGFAVSKQFNSRRVDVLEEFNNALMAVTTG